MHQDFPKAYEAALYEAELYELWEKSGAFSPDKDPKKKPYAIMMPPPNATGVLHLGHATMLAVEDLLIRYKRMRGYAALYLPGTDHAAIATQSVVEAKLQSEGIANPLQELGREAFLQKIREFVAASQDNIRNQVRKMGASCDWTREKYTFSPEMNHAVNTLFEMMYEDGLIYRGGRMVNWDPKMQTTVADDEIEYEEETTAFYYFQFGPIVIATARPETKFQDNVLIVHPDDERYQEFIGKEFEAEWIDGPIKIKVIADECVDPELGTGAMSISPAHSQVDFDLAQKYDLPAPQIIDFNGKIRAGVSASCGNLHINEARKKVVEILDRKGLLVKIDKNYAHKIAVNYRGKGLLEPQIMEQWFIDVNKKVVDWKGNKLSLKEVMAETVSSGMINIFPSRFNKTYFHWIDNLRDWCISRQIIWGHRIPVWTKDGEVKLGANSPGEGWSQDPDTLDTWFSSGLWTFSTLGWPEKTEDLQRFAPSAVLETGYDILFFWVARMILQTTYALRKSGFTEEKSIPFKDVYLHGLIRDVHGKKMSKSRPETCIDPLDMIEKYGTDAVRLSLIIGSSPGNDMRLYEEKIGAYRNFVNKIWNGARFVVMNLDESSGDLEDLNAADKWILTRLSQVQEELTESMEAYQLSEAGMKIYDFFWGEFCDWYLEMSKVSKNEAVLRKVLETSLKLMHPFMPFVTEAIWREYGKKTGSNAGLLISESWPENENFAFHEDLQKIKILREIIHTIRKLRTDSGVQAAQKIILQVQGTEHIDLLRDSSEVIIRMSNLSEIIVHEKYLPPAQIASAHLGELSFYLELSDLLDPVREMARLSKEKELIEKFVLKLKEKLENPAFRKNAAPNIIQMEEAKYSEAISKLDKILASILELEEKAK